MPDIITKDIIDRVVVRLFQTNERASIKTLDAIRQNVGPALEEVADDIAKEVNNHNKTPAENA